MTATTVMAAHRKPAAPWAGWTRHCCGRAFWMPPAKSGCIATRVCWALPSSRSVSGIAIAPAMTRTARCVPFWWRSTTPLANATFTCSIHRRLARHCKRARCFTCRPSCSQRATTTFALCTPGATGSSARWHASITPTPACQCCKPVSAAVWSQSPGARSATPSGATRS